METEAKRLSAKAALPGALSSLDRPLYHIAALTEEGVCSPYDPNGCLFWHGRYHLMYIFQDHSRPKNGHSWGHLSSSDLVNWAYHPPALVPEPGDADTGTFSGNAFVSREGVPMLCWFGIDAGVCIAHALDDGLIRWQKHPANPIIPIPKPGTAERDLYTVWDPYLWLEGDTYYCLLGGNRLPNGKDTLFLLRSPDLVHWTPLHPFYEHSDLTWTGEGEDCSCPDFFALGDRHVLLCISHKVGARCYVGRFDRSIERFFPTQHVRMNWPGGMFFAPESLLDDRGRRLYWAWVTDPRIGPSQRAVGSGVMSLPRVLSQGEDGGLRIAPAEELQALRGARRGLADVALAADSEVALEGIAGTFLELDAEIEPGAATAIGLKVRCSPDGAEETGIWYDATSHTLRIETSRSTLRTDVTYGQPPFLAGGLGDASENPHPFPSVEAPFDLAPGELLRLRLFLDGPILEVFANERQCVTVQIFPSRADGLLVRACARGCAAMVRRIDAWEMMPARFINEPNC